MKGRKGKAPPLARLLEARASEVFTLVSWGSAVSSPAVRVISGRHVTEWPTACRATCPSFIVTTAIHTSPMTLGCISTRKDTSYSILCSSSCRGDDTTSPQPSGSSSPWYDASTPYGGSSHDANDGPSSSWDDASGTCSWNEAAHGRPHANDAWAPNDETSCPSHDGAHSARNDSTRQIRIEGRLHCISFILPVLLHQEIMLL
ncbi:uncharacterized protein LOC116460503 [Hylobates moloch]|uniref:uncharacterized protein LOC116460503 n=1 Tax=Hylobates moloch TaxID=81572 RepID=UPI001363DDFF|nr:uncharacterized protein LOC116460503 [Hylobates moloch]